MIVKNYKAYRRWNVIPKILNIRKNDNATIIQKFLKGFLVYNRLNRKIKNNKITTNFIYFVELRKKLED